MDERDGRIMKLQSDLQEKIDLLSQAGEIGNCLLERNSDLQTDMDDMTRDHAKQVEALEQANHTLQASLDNRQRMETNYVDEIEALKSEIQKAKNVRQDSSLQKLSVLENKVRELRAEVDQVQLREAQLLEKITHYEQLIYESQLEEKDRSLNVTCSAEMADLLSELSALKASKIELTSCLMEKSNKLEQLRLREESLTTNLAEKEREVEENLCQISSYFNALERSREEVQDMKHLMEVERMQSSSHSNKGNSLFGELEDKRVKAEKMVISLRVSNESLKKQNDMNKQQQHQLKMQLATVLQMTTNRVDSGHVERLQSQLAQARGEVRALMDKVHKYERLQSGETDRKVEFSLAFSGDNSDKNYAEYVQKLLKKKKVPTATLR